MRDDRYELLEMDNRATLVSALVDWNDTWRRRGRQAILDHLQVVFQKTLNNGTMVLRYYHVIITLQTLPITFRWGHAEKGNAQLPLKCLLPIPQQQMPFKSHNFLHVVTPYTLELQIILVSNTFYILLR